MWEVSCGPEEIQPKTQSRLYKTSDSDHPPSEQWKCYSMNLWICCACPCARPVRAAQALKGMKLLAFFNKWLLHFLWGCCFMAGDSFIICLVLVNFLSLGSSVQAFTKQMTCFCILWPIFAKPVDCHLHFLSSTCTFLNLISCLLCITCLWRVLWVEPIEKPSFSTFWFC